MKVHTSLRKRPLVLLQLLICMGVLSNNKSVNAIQIRNRSLNTVYSDLSMYGAEIQEQDDAQAEQTAVETQEAEAPAEGQAQATEEQAAQEAPAQAEAAQEAPAEEVQEQVVEQPQPVARVKKAVSDTPDVNQAAALAAAAEELYPDVSKMTATQKKSYELKKRKEAEAEKRRLKEKEAKENPTVDENGEHIQTVAEAKELARQLQSQLEEGERAVEEKIALQQEQLAAEPPAQIAAEEAAQDDGHEETVEEVKAKMAALQKGMEDGIAATDAKIEKQNKEMGEMPDFGALANLHGSIANMGKMRKRNQAKSLAQKFGVDLQDGEEDLSASDLTQTLMSRAKEAGKTDEEIAAAMAD